MTAMTSQTPDYLKPYIERLEETGPTFEALLWNNPDSQAARFRTIAQMVELHNRHILDAGCGRADLAHYLKQHTTQTPSHYTGIDAIPELLAVAQQAAQDNQLVTPPGHTHLVNADFASAQSPDFYTSANPSAPPPDIIIFSGSLNTFEEKQARGTLRWAWKAANEALVFNFLSDKPGKIFRSKPNGPAKRFNTLRMIRWALTKTPFVAVRHDYLAGNDCTILMRKPNAQAPHNIS